MRDVKSDIHRYNLMFCHSALQVVIRGSFIHHWFQFFSTSRIPQKNIRLKPPGKRGITSYPPTLGDSMQWSSQ